MAAIIPQSYLAPRAGARRRPRARAESGPRAGSSGHVPSVHITLAIYRVNSTFEHEVHLNPGDSGFLSLRDRGMAHVYTHEDGRTGSRNAFCVSPWTDPETPALGHWPVALHRAPAASSVEWTVHQRSAGISGRGEQRQGCSRAGCWRWTLRRREVVEELHGALVVECVSAGKKCRWTADRRRPRVS